MIELRHFQHFIAVVSSKGIRQAARDIHISPSSLTRSIQFLEEYYETPLLQRHGGQMILTPHGEQVFQEFKGILKGVESIKPKLAQLDAIEYGSLRVGLNPTIADTLLPKIGTRFITEYPKVRITTVIGTVTRLLNLLADGELDLIIGLNGVLEKERGIEMISLVETEALWWVRKHHPLLSKEEVSFADFVNYPYLSQHLPPAYKDYLHELCQQDGVHLDSISQGHQCDDYRALYLMATQSDAILLSHAFISHNDYFTDKLCQLQTRQQMPKAQFSVALPIQPIPSPLARRYVEILKEETDLIVALCKDL
ncbi:MAG: DNA-binding transcriptional LysR family regulator [Lentimonas sp.]|jgi:DNA-binding transcriptional LysR family regulator